MNFKLMKQVKRLALFAAVGFVLSQMLPSLADQLTPNPVVDSAEPSASAEASPSPSDAPIYSASSPADPKADVTYLPSETPTIKAKVIDSPSLFFKVPNAIQVDPRATSARTDSFALGGAQDILVCATSGRANLSVSAGSHVLTSGQGTHSLLISGTASDVLSTLTAHHGLTLTAAGRISGSVASFAVAALNKPSVDSALCGGAQFTRSMAVTALGIDLNTVKAPVNMGKK